MPLALSDIMIKNQNRPTDSDTKGRSSFYVYMCQSLNELVYFLTKGSFMICRNVESIMINYYIYI